MTYKIFKRELMKITSMSDGTKAMKIERLKAMHDFVCNYYNDEGNIEVWLASGMPDCATNDDYTYVAEDYNLYKEVKDLFFRLSNKELEEIKRVK